MVLHEKYKKFDIDGDGKLSLEELEKQKTIIEFELREEKADTQRRMAWLAMGSMLIFTIVLFSPLINDSRVSALADLLGLFYVAQAGIVGAYMGFQSWMNRNNG